MTLAYLGTAFAGWQRQPGVSTVQGTMEAALARLFGSPVTVTAAGRTDAGVHAAGQVAHADLPVTIPGDGLRAAMAGALPPEVRVVRAGRVSPEFHALRDARGKRYVYRFLWKAPRLPWSGLRSAVARPPADRAAMAKAAALFRGRLDVASFTVPDHGRAGTVRTIRRFELRFRPAGLTVTVEGDGFLRYQVRRMVGLLMEVGWGRRSVADVARFLDDPEPGRAVWTAPGRGLTLERVFYGAAAPGAAGAVVDFGAQG